MASSGGGSNGGLRAVMLSPNLIAEPYTGPLPWIPASAFLGAAGWREFYRRSLGRVRNVNALAKVSKIPGWTLAKFKAEAMDTYTAVNVAIAAGDETVLRHRTTESVLAALKKQLKERQRGGWARVDWALDGLDEATVVQGRVLQPSAESQMAWAQLTVELRSRQRFAAYDAVGKRVAGDMSAGAAVKVVDHWVMERALMPKLPDALKPWRLAARLTLPQRT